MSLLPPTGLAGNYQNKASNVNTLQTKLTWVAPTGSDPFDKYYIYKNDLKIADVDDAVLVYYDEDMAKSVNYATYYVTTWKDALPSPIESIPSDYLSNFSLAFEDLITRLRNSYLMDNPTDSRMKRWTDEQLLEYLNIGLDDVNTEPPMTNYNYETIPQPWRSLILMRAKFEALTSRASIEVAKEFNFGFGGVSVTIDRSGKYLAVGQQEWNAYNDRLHKAKLAHVMSFVSPQVLLTSDLPFKIRTFAPRQYRVR